MKSFKLTVSAVFFASMLVAPVAQGQFSRMKDRIMNNVSDKAADKASDKINDKLGLNSSQQGAASEKKEKGSFGEAKASLAPGANKSANVSRQSGGTPEAQQASPVSAGGMQVATIKISNADARKFDSVRGYGACSKVSNFQVLSASQVRVSVDLSSSKSGGTCQLYFRSGGNTVFMAPLVIRGK